MPKLLLSFLLFTNIIFSQNLIFEKEYSQLPFKLDITNSGVYSIASFDVDAGVIYFSSFTESGVFKSVNGRISKSDVLLNKGADFIANKNELGKTFTKILNNELLNYKKSFVDGFSLLADDGGIINGSKGEELILSVPNRNKLIIKTNISSIKNRIDFDFAGNLACANLIGIDKNGNIFVKIEKYISDIPLVIESMVYTISSNGELISQLQLPNINYLYTIKNLQIDEAGNLYHLLSFKEKVQIVKWSNLTNPTKKILRYGNEYNKNIHFNNYRTTEEYEKPLVKNIESKVDRAEALRFAERYATHQFEVTEQNLARENTVDSYGITVRTPDWLIVGDNGRIPYKWGGFSTLEQFDDGIANGKFAGDIYTNKSSGTASAVGVDCSGFVSRCWQLPYQVSTRQMPGITTVYSSWDDIKPGDGILIPGHVRLFVERNANGSFRIIESAGTGWGVRYWTFTLSDLQNYEPVYYENMIDEFNTNQPTLLSANNVDNEVELQWSCDTTGIIGFRLYQSSNGEEWSELLNEQTCKSDSVRVTKENGQMFYRVSSVKNESQSGAESNWSNVLGVATLPSDKSILIVDGFERASGSWRGPGHSFVVRYGKALEQLSYNYVSIKNSELQNEKFNLKDYDYVFWILGDESTVDETFNSAEQLSVKAYLENGGSLFLSGSEIGWDLDYKGDSEDKAFYNNYLKSNYRSDDAGSNTAAGLENSALNGCSAVFGQIYTEDYPDEIESQNGSNLCMRYSNGKGAGVQFTGNFGNSNATGNLIYLAFPLETTASDESFNTIISSSIEFFKSHPTTVDDNLEIITEFRLEQNYPNPFNPNTTIKYSIPTNVSRELSIVSLKIYDILGRKVATLVKAKQAPGNYMVEFDASELSSGIYIYKLIAGKNILAKKLMLLK